MDKPSQNDPANSSDNKPDVHTARKGISCETEDALLQDRRHLISMRAYQHAIERGFVPGKALEDWLRAEAEVKKNTG